MWVFFGIVLFLAALITAIILLPVNIIIKKDDKGDMQILYKILHKTFGEEPDPNNPIVKVIKKGSGISRIEGSVLKQNAKDNGLLATTTETCRLVLALLREVVDILKYVKIKRFFLDVSVSGDDAAETAIDYGKCCAAVYPLCGFVSSHMKVKKGGLKINISPSFETNDEHFDYDFVLSIGLGKLLAAFLRLAYKEAVRTVNEQNQSS